MLLPSRVLRGTPAEYLRPAAARLLCSEGATSSSGAVVVGTEKRGKSLGRRLVNLRYPNRSAVVAITRWLREGNNPRLHKHDLLRIVRQLRELKRYKHALEVCEWMATQANIRLQPGDYAVHLDLIAKVRGLASAEKFFDDLPEPMKNQSTHTSLLNVYVQNNLLSKAESMMETMAARRFLTSCLPYNHMINLYLTNGLLDKLPKMIEELKKNVLPDVVTYNLLLTACSSTTDLKGAEKIFVEMHERNILPGWITYSILTKLYIRKGMPGMARKSLKEMEEVLPKEERKAYCSLMTLYANLSDKDDVNRIWDNMKLAFKKMTVPEYCSVIACLVKVGDLEQAESIYAEWESISGVRTMKVPNILLSGYTRSGMMEKAERFIEQNEKNGLKSNYTAWEIMAWGYLEQNKMDDTLRCLRKALVSLKKWKPDDKIVNAVFDKLEISGDIETAENFLVMLRKAGYMTTSLYNLLLRTYKKARKMPFIILERMKKDNMEPDDETQTLLESISKLCAPKVLSP